MEIGETEDFFRDYGNITTLPDTNSLTAMKIKHMPLAFDKRIADCKYDVRKGYQILNTRWRIYL
ncbi:hypothetical protein [Sphingobacterium spiritivorum]|uniref:hypothetical protein n=1 Tax=Sphingobacterium spiritivorum TaxID=258 RepID=UPI003DA43988